MPILVGGKWNKGNKKGSYYTDNLLTIANQFIDDQHLIISTDTWRIIGGKKWFESQSELIYPLLNEQGVLVGRMFTIDKLDHFFNQTFINQVLKSQGNYLAKYCWGKYCLILEDKLQKKLYIFRDPLGFTTLYFCKIQGGVLFSSELFILQDALKENLKIDWGFFSSYVSCGNFITNHTPFSEIQELLPGHCLIISEESYTTKCYWDPTAIATHYSQDTERSIIEEFLACVSKWIEDSSGLGLHLSGGLDSTALLMAISKVVKQDQHLIAINFSNLEVASSNELEFAKKAAEACQVKLIEYYWDNNTCLAVPNKSFRCNKPSSSLLYLKAKQEIASLIKSYGDIELMDGHGGDQLFLASPYGETLCDYFLDKGFKGILTKLYALSNIHRQPGLFFIKQSIKYLYRYLCGLGYQSEAFPNNDISWFEKKFNELVKPEIFYPSYWSRLSELPPGKAKHILSIYHSAFFADGGLGTFEMPVFYPYLSQPLVELALSIPSYETFNHTHSRNQFRQAISRSFNTDLVWRQSKGETSGIVQLGLRKNSKRVLELCIEGVFSQQGLVSKEKLYRHIKLIEHGLMKNQWPLINLLAAELWFEAWGLKG